MALKSKKVFCGFLCFLGLLQPCISQPTTLPKNEYGLEVVRKSKVYLLSIQADSNKRMVPVKNYVRPLTVDWKYASAENFTKTVLYNKPTAYVRLPVAKALEKVQNQLKAKGLSLKFYDAYRPYHITKLMWKVVPDERYAANPAKGSGHNRGAAVDVTLVELLTLKELPMPTPFDDFTEKAHHNYKELPAEVIKNRAILREAMEQAGFVALDTEWWHYYLPNAAQRFELMDLSFKQLRKLSGKS